MNWTSIPDRAQVWRTDDISRTRFGLNRTDPLSVARSTIVGRQLVNVRVLLTPIATEGRPDRVRNSHAQTVLRRLLNFLDA